MLRRKLLMLLVPLVTLLAVTLIVSILLLQDVLGRIDRHVEAMVLMRVEGVDSAAAVGHAEDERAVAGRFKWVVLSLWIVFLIVINVSVLVLLRVGGKVPRPVERLGAAGRELGREHFEHRVEIGPAGGEFDELGRAYNRMAEQLQANERGRIEA